MSSVLFDVPGPRTRARHRIGSVVGAVLIAAVLGLVGWKLWVEEAITPEKWSFLTEPSIVLALAEGMLQTLLAAAVAIVLAIVFGAIFASGRLSDHAFVRWPCVAVVEFFRAVPLLLLIFFMFLAYGTTLGTFGALVIALMLYNGSVLAEIFRAGLLAVPRGQGEAAYSIGMGKRQVMMIVLAPQAVRSMLPAIISQCVVALKDTALGYTIGYSGIVREGEAIYGEFTRNNPIAVAMVIAAAFIVVNYALSRLAVYVESRLRSRGRTVVHVGAEAE